MPEPIESFPIFPFLEELAGLLAREKLLLLTAETGAGKTTLFPWKLLSHPEYQTSKILLLEPRRLAARAAAERISALRGEKVGQTVGLRTRLETRVGGQTRLEVVTEGVLTRIVQEDPSLSGYGTLLFDEFHTRSLQGDLGLALAWEARRIFRPDLRIALLSATLPVEEIQHRLGPLPMRDIPGRSHPVKIFYEPPLGPHEKPWEGAARLCQSALARSSGPTAGTVLCFLPGYREMLRTRELLIRARAGNPPEILLLHGSMPPEQQRSVLNPADTPARRILLSTNVAETSLTIPGVTAVVDIGLERRVRFSPRTGMDHWETVPISRASARQRQGRAGRTSPGICLRWWPEKERREPFPDPEILEADLASLVLEIALWGSDSPLALSWITPPPEGALRQAKTLLQTLELLDASGVITPAGRAAAGLAVHPRLARMIGRAPASQVPTAAVMAALLENEDLLPGPDPDFRDRICAFRDQTRRGGGSALVIRIAEDARRLLAAAGKKTLAPATLSPDPEAAGELLAFAYPDRIAQRTRVEPDASSRWLLASGRGARMQGPLSRSEFLAVAQVDGGEMDARIFLAAPIARARLESGQAGALLESWSLEWKGWKPAGRQQTRLGALLLGERVGPLPPLETLQAAANARLEKSGLADLPWTEKSRRLLARCRWVQRWGTQAHWPDFSEKSLLAGVSEWLFPFGNWREGEIFEEGSLAAALEHRLDWRQRKLLDELAPERLLLPSGSLKKPDYESGDIPVLAARLQDFFGCRTTPALCGQPLLLNLLSPAGRTVQLTRDLDGFWERGYPEVKKELQGRYPRHAWPENPRAAHAAGKRKPKS